MAKFETVPIGELKHRLPAKLLPLVEEYKDKLEKLPGDQGGRLVLEKGDDAKDLRRALKAAATSLNRRIRFPFRGEEGSLSFYLEGQRGRRRRLKRLSASGGGRGGRRAKSVLYICKRSPSSETGALFSAALKYSSPEFATTARSDPRAA